MNNRDKWLVYFLQRDRWVLFPLGVNFVLAMCSISGSGNFADTVWLCNLVVVLAIIASLLSILGFVIGEIGPLKVKLAILFHAIVLIFVYAGIYSGYGLTNTVQVSRETALYFSIVTWTTLGYGDLAPKEGIRLIAASQAVLGYIFLGLLVGLLTDAIGQPKVNSATSPPQRRSER